MGAQFTVHMSERVDVTVDTASSFSLFDGDTELPCDMETPPQRVLPDGSMRGEHGVEFVCEGILSPERVYALRYSGGLESMSGEDVTAGLIGRLTSFDKSFQFSHLPRWGSTCRWLSIR